MSDTTLYPPGCSTHSCSETGIVAQHLVLAGSPYGFWLEFFPNGGSAVSVTITGRSGSATRVFVAPNSNNTYRIHESGPTAGFIEFASGDFGYLASVTYTGLSHNPMHKNTHQAYMDKALPQAASGQVPIKGALYWAPGDVEVGGSPRLTEDAVTIDTVDVSLSGAVGTHTQTQHQVKKSTGDWNTPTDILEDYTTTDATGLLNFLAGSCSNLAEGTTKTQVKSSEFYYNISGVGYRKQAVDGTTMTGTTGNNTLPDVGTDRYGVWMFQINAAGTISVKSSTNADAGWTTFTEAKDACPAVDSGNFKMGMVIVFNPSANASWVGGSTALNATNVVAWYLPSMSALVSASPYQIRSRFYQDSIWSSYGSLSSTTSTISPISNLGTGTTSNVDAGNGNFETGHSWTLITGSASAIAAYQGETAIYLTPTVGTAQAYRKDMNNSPILATTYPNLIFRTRFAMQKIGNGSADLLWFQFATYYNGGGGYGFYFRFDNGVIKTYDSGTNAATLFTWPDDGLFHTLEFRLQHKKSQLGVLAMAYLDGVPTTVTLPWTDGYGAYPQNNRVRVQLDSIALGDINNHWKPWITHIQIGNGNQ